MSPSNIDYLPENSLLAFSTSTVCRVYHISQDIVVNQTLSMTGQNISYVKILTEYHALLAEKGALSVRWLETGDVLRNIAINSNQFIQSIVLDKQIRNHVIIGDNFGQIFFHDLRLRNSLIDKVKCHSLEILSLKLNSNHLLASASADNTVKVFDLRKSQCLMNPAREKCNPMSLDWVNQNCINYTSGKNKNVLTFKHVYSGSVWQHNLFNKSLLTMALGSPNELISITKSRASFYLEHIRFSPSRVQSNKFVLSLGFKPLAAFIDESLDSMIVFNKANKIIIYNLRQLNNMPCQTYS